MLMRDFILIQNQYKHYINKQEIPFVLCINFNLQANVHNKIVLCFENTHQVYSLQIEDFMGGLDLKEICLLLVLSSLSV